MREARRCAELADAAGAVRVSVWDSPAVAPDCWLTLGHIAAAIRGAAIGVSVTNPLTRHPVVTANAAASLASLIPGRAFLGIGTGDSGVINLGARPARLSELREYVLCLRSLLREGTGRWRGATVRLRSKPEAPVPIYLAAHGVNSLRLAAELADGVILGLGHSEDVVDGVREVIATTRDRTGGADTGFDLWWNCGAVRISEDADAAVRETGWLTASFAHHLARGDMASKFVPPDLHDGIRRLAANYDLGLHGRQPDAMRARYVELAQEFGVWEYLLDRFIIAGSRSGVRDQLRLLADRGVTNLETGVSVGGVEAAADLISTADETNWNREDRFAADRR
ncbi:LLM class flavin-dependent oxidoreductase [Nocardia sp. NPDC005978]|uniref:LLM class flavin-dependent oxidoreductase n=1 Tax=Nocardia sp. NPDC005978 TaxID=3156725 RepID=UPI0033A27413